jgi:hypothetical protein
MTEPIISQPASVAPGQIAFYDQIAPPLAASATPYTLSAKQSVLDLKEGPVPPYSATQSVLVSGPRFAIDPASIHTVFPPAGHVGSYRDVLPHIVFREFALPWMRSVDESGDPDGPPWMALLTIADTEMPAAPGQPPTSPNSMLTFPTAVPPAQVAAPSAGNVLAPNLTGVGAGNGELALVTDMNLGFFRAIAPRRDELPFLAHARVVNTAGKIMLGMQDDGCFSVVTGNRVPQAPGGYTALLVSLEGHGAHLPDSPAPDSKYTAIRVVVLGSWSFTTADSPGDFLTLMAQLTQPGRGGVRLLRLDPPADMASDPATAQALAIGYVALGNDLRDGELTTSLYRGPLVPAPTARHTEYGPYYLSDHAVLYDPDYGLFNHAYACAWQIGRLLALSDAAFVQRLIDWRRSYAAAQAAAANRRAVVAPAAAALNPGAAAAAAGLPAQLRGFFAARVAANTDALPVVVPRGENPALRELPGAAPGLRAAAAAAHDEETDPLLRLRARLGLGGGR